MRVLQLIQQVPEELWGAKLALQVTGCVDHSGFANQGMQREQQQARVAGSWAYSLCCSWGVVNERPVLGRQVGRRVVAMQVTNTELACVNQVLQVPLVEVMLITHPLCRRTWQQAPCGLTRCEGSSVVKPAVLCCFVLSHRYLQRIQGSDSAFALNICQACCTVLLCIVPQVLAARIQGSDSAFAPYIANLPVGVSGVPMFFAREALEAIEYPPVVEQVGTHILSIHCTMALAYFYPNMSTSSNPGGPCPYASPDHGPSSALQFTLAATGAC